MSSGTEKSRLDSTCSTAHHQHQDGFFINIIVHGINVGAQSYWNASSVDAQRDFDYDLGWINGTNQTLDFSGSVSAEDERGIGGAEKIMGPNGQSSVYLQQSQ